MFKPLNYFILAKVHGYSTVYIIFLKMKLFGHERTPMDEAVSGGKLEVMDAINEAVALVTLAAAMV